MEQRGDDAAVSESPSSSESGGNFEITFGDARAPEHSVAQKK